MPVKVQVPKKAGFTRFLFSRWGKLFLASSVFLITCGVLTFTYYYVHFARIIEEKLAEGPFPNTSLLFASPRTVTIGDEATASEIAVQLKHAGYTEESGNRSGWYHLRPGAIEVFPGPDSYFDDEAGVLKFDGDRVAQIISLRDHTERTMYMLEPQLITNLFDHKREKRRLVHYADIPPVLRNAILSAEDKRFFQHAGFDPLGIIRSAWMDVKTRSKSAGGSTLTMQLARTLWLSSDKSWKRKAAEILVTMHLEQKLTKEQIFEYYANAIDLGRRGSFAIRGFGEAAQAYFGKDIRQLTLPEAATLAGLVQRPSATNPYRWPDRARARRNLVLGLMRQNGYITEREYAEAVAAPLVVSRAGVESLDAPYFVDMVNDELQEQFQAHDFQSKQYRVYTTLDLNLQQVAAEAVREGMKEVDEAVKRRFRSRAPNYPEAQCALVAVDPQTGEIKALVGGRNYGISQLNRAEAKRQPGSSFKPFVYAAALNTALTEGSHVITPVTTIIDEPTTFWYDNKPYEPSNFKKQYYGTVTLRQAITKSLNIPTVKLAEAVGYGPVVDLARKAGLNMDIQPTPAVALGAYEVKPVEIASAYTVFANHGEYVEPSMIKFIRDDRGKPIYEAKPDHRQVLDPRVAYLMVSLLESVINNGTAAGARSRGFTLPAAGKTGSSHDGWFAGFTSKLICVVWVGFDDNSDVKLEGAQTALPVWTAFMKRAHLLREYRNVRPFEAPDGIVSVEIDPATGQLATPVCPGARSEVFIAGTQPVEMCRLHGGGGVATQVAGWEASGAAGPAQPGPTSTASIPQASQAPSPVIANARTPSASPQNPSAVRPQGPEKPKKRGFFGRIRDIFR